MVDFQSERNKVGVDDMVMLSEISEKAIQDNLRKRYKEGIIYTSIGQVLIALNPYTDLKVFEKPLIQKYQDKDPFHIPPHVFTIANDAYRAMISEGENQSIIISGESGAGKTETSKGIMQYLAAVTGKGNDKSVDRVKDIILESNPLLESFGNAKTLRNNNSSRFGKYIEIQFDYKGDPEGGRIRNYLLEKSRVVQQTPNERSFHIFYQLFHASDQEKSSWKLNGLTADSFRFLNSSKCYTADGIDDKKWFQQTKHAMGVVGISSGDQDSIFKLLAAVLHLGNITFKPAAKDSAVVADKSVLNTAASLFGVNPDALEKALCYRLISSASARTSTYQVPQNVSQAEFSRDALAKNIFSRLFDWLVGRVNIMIETRVEGKVIGILDIYGFEIFQTNSFEQLCINYCNETLHQIFIDLTLKMEQEEYVREGIKWEPVQYVNNKPCVDLIQGKPLGILSLLDEECLFPEGTDQSMVQKLHKNFSNNAHYKVPTESSQKNTKFSIVHYAGLVTYTCEGFLEKNRDTLYNDLVQLVLNSSNSLLSEIFIYSNTSSGAIADEEPKVQRGGKKRPVTAGFQFKNSMASLLKALYSCQPHYIRCIKPNDEKKALTFTDAKVAEQMKYLGLLENLKVRRAGFCYRQTYDKWIARYYMISDKTFPKWKGEPKEGVELLVKHALQLPAEEYQMGKTKLFVRSPKALFDIEEQRLKALHRIATKIQSVWRAWKIRKVYLDLKREALDIFKGQKERTRTSMARGTVSFFGDFLGLKENQEIKTLISKTGDTKIIFSELVNKINRRFKVQQRAIVLTDKGLYNLKKLEKPKKGNSFVFKRRVDIQAIDSISVSKLADNFFVVHIPSEYDYVYESPKKTIFITLLKDFMKKELKRDFQIKVVESIGYKIRKGQQKAISFSKDETAHEAQTKKSKNTLQVKISSGIAENKS